MIELDGATTVLAPAPDRRLGYATAGGGVTVTTGDAVAWLLVEGGRGRLTVDGSGVEVDGRDDVFGGVGASAFLGPGSTAEAGDGLRCLVVWRSYAGPALPSRVIDAGEVSVEDRGAGTFARTVRTYLHDGPLIAGETLNPPGGWSSYPPHRHDEHEEAYLYRFAPREGFGLAATYDGDVRTGQVVRDGDVTWIPSGYHPVVAAPGYTMLYVWALAGDAPFAPTLDPTHAWVS